MKSVLDGFCLDNINIVGFPREAPLLLIENQYIMSTKAKPHRVFIKDKQQNGTQIIKEVKKLLEEKYAWIKRIKITSQQWICARTQYNIRDLVVGGTIWMDTFIEMLSTFRVY